MRKLPLLLAVGQFTAAIGSIGIARAQSPPGAAAPSPAQRLREQGSAEANAGRLPEALAAWRAAWALSPNHRGLACDIGRGELLAGHNVEAMRWMSRCVRLTQDSGPRGVQRGRSDVVDLAVARSRVAEITLDVEAGAALRLNGESVGTAPLPEPLFVEPGRQYRLEARKGAKVAAATVDAVAGQEHRVSLALKVEPPPFLGPEPQAQKEARRSPPPPEPPGARSPRAFVWWPAVTGAALTVTAFGIGAALGAVGSIARDDKDVIRARIMEDTRGLGCGKFTNHPECEAYGEVDRRRAAFSNAATGFFIAGGIFAAATVGYAAYEKDRVSVSITTGGAVGRYVW
jgi:hypothetical protein